MNKITLSMMKSFTQSVDMPMAFTGLCQAPAENYYKTEAFTLDFWGDTNEIAPVVTDLKDGNNKFSIEDFLNKEFKAPAMLDEFTVSTFKLLERAMGKNTFEDPNAMASLTSLFKTHMRVGSDRQRRTVEYMVAQMLQTGKIILNDADGNPAYEIDFQQKTSHLPTLATAWTDSENATPFSDLENMGDLIVTDGHKQPTRIMMSQQAYYALSRTKEYLDMADNRRVNIVKDTSAPKIDGMMYKGTLDLVAYTLHMYVYTGEVTIAGTAKRLMNSGSVIMTTDNPRIDLTFGDIPLVVKPDSRVSFLSGRAKIQSRLMDIHTNAWVSQDGRHVSGFVGSRPLPILTAKNEIVCADCGAV